MTDSQNGSHPTKLRIGSRGSQLALWQANHISALLRARGHEVEIEIIHTTGDKITDVALAMVGTKGMFLAAAGAGPVYKLLGKKDLGTTEFPAIETPLIDGDIAFRQHSSGHTPAPNWPVFLRSEDR